MMERTTILLPARLKKLASRHAAEEHISLAELIRTLLEQQLSERTLAKASDVFFADTEIYTGEAPSDLAKNHDDYLYGKNQ